MTKTPPGVWDNRFMAMARLVSGWSKDPDEGVGCVLVSPDRRRIAFGYNGLPRDCPEALEERCLANHSLKLEISLHAEANAVANARCDVAGWTAYTSKAPCAACAKALHAHGIGRVVMPPLRRESRWYADQHRALDFFQDLGVHYSIRQPEDL